MIDHERNEVKKKTSVRLLKMKRRDSYRVFFNTHYMHGKLSKLVKIVTYLDI